MTLEAYQLGYARDDFQLFDDLSFGVAAGEALWLAGSNGSGKTSLLRLLCGLATPHSGQVRWSGVSIAQLREEFYQHLIYIGHASGVKDDLSAWENLVFTSQLFGVPCDRDQAYKALAHMGLAHIAHLPARALSQGQRKRVSLARLCLRPLPSVLILDEPFTALDKNSVDMLIALLDDHLAHEGIVVYTTHQDVSLNARQLHVLNLADRVRKVANATDLSAQHQNERVLSS